MCGIAGYLTKENIDSSFFIEKAVDSLKHRGPDEYGNFIDSKACLLNTRLSIIDLANGSQPFISDDGSKIVVQNGEIYNYLELKDELIKKGINFKTNSDTEVILKAYEFYGEECFSKLNGMFAIAILDNKKNELLLCRDRLGVKPLYLYTESSSIYFSSEIKTFLDIPSFDKTINKQSVHNYLKFNYIPLPQTIFKCVEHVNPGHFLKLCTDTLSFTSIQYWDIENKEEIDIDEKELLDQMDTVLNSAIDIRLRSDVGIGAFLSGGLDSSLICSMVKKNFNISLDSYTIGFPEKRFDESAWAKKVAEYAGIPNNVSVLDADIVSLWSTTTWFNDQPHGDISFIPTFYLSQFASKQYKVVFTGDGGDEACAGYTKYFSIFKDSLDEYFDNISLIKDDAEYNYLYTEDFKDGLDFAQPKDIFTKTLEKVSNKDDINKILYFDTKQLLPGNNLVKPDKMAMANSLETRSPMLDFRFFELMQSVPGSLKLSNNETKYILKKFAQKYLPDDVIYRDKQMFTVPVGEWFKGKLKDYLIEIIFSKSLENRNIFNIRYLEMITNEHFEGIKDRTRELRAIVNLEIWFRRFIDL